MNTKIYISIIALMLMFPKSFSVGASSQNQIFQVQTPGHIITSSDNKHNNKALDWTLDWSYDDSIHHHNQSDDDNKSHHFHYDRFSKKRSRILLSILFKILLLITHLSSLLYASIHILH